MNRGVVAVALASAVLVFAGCAQQYGPNGQGVSPVEVKLPDGREVTCVVASSGGVDCDWESAQ